MNPRQENLIQIERPKGRMSLEDLPSQPSVSPRRCAVICSTCMGGAATGIGAFFNDPSYDFGIGSSKSIKDFDDFQGA
jgi:hypothetical protein